MLERVPDPQRWPQVHLRWREGETAARIEEACVLGSSRFGGAVLIGNLGIGELFPWKKEGPTGP